jgi:soluble lytic murein transglycosylase
VLEDSPSASVPHELARSRLAAQYLAEGTPRLAIEALERPTSGAQAVLLGDAHAAAGDTLAALAALVAFGTESGASVAERFPAIRKAASWAGPFADGLSEQAHAALCRALGAVGEADRGLALLAARRIEPRDADAAYARAEIEASLLAKARRYVESAAAYRAMAVRTALPKSAPEGIALELARAWRGARAFAPMDSAFVDAVRLASGGAVAEQAAWERAREWEDVRPAREAAAIFGWAARHIRSKSLRAAARVHEAIAWKRAGFPDSARIAVEEAPDSDVLGAFWQGKLALEAGDTTAAIAEFRRASDRDPSSYEGVRGGEEAARLGASRRNDENREPLHAGDRSRPESEELEIRLLVALGWHEIASDRLRRCAREGKAPEARACIDALEEAGTFRVGKRSLLPAERFDFPPAFPGAVLEAAAAEQVPPALLWAIMRQESAYDPLARSKAGALGLLQLLPSTAAQLAGRSIPEDSLTVPALNVRLGARYVQNLLREFGDPRAVLASYNAGEDAVRRWNRGRASVDDEWVERIPYRETRDYVKRVYAAWRHYEAIYGVAAPAAGG